MSSGPKHEAVGSLIMGNMLNRNLIKAQSAFPRGSRFFAVTTVEVQPPPASLLRCVSLRAPGRVVASRQAFGSPRSGGVVTGSAPGILKQANFQIVPRRHWSLGHLVDKGQWGLEAGAICGPTKPQGSRLSPRSLSRTREAPRGWGNALP